MIYTLSTGTWFSEKAKRINDHATGNTVAVIVDPIGNFVLEGIFEVAAKNGYKVFDLDTLQWVVGDAADLSGETTEPKALPCRWCKKPVVRPCHSARDASTCKGAV